MYLAGRGGIQAALETEPLDGKTIVRLRNDRAKDAWLSEFAVGLHLVDITRRVLETRLGAGSRLVLARSPGRSGAGRRGENPRAASRDLRIRMGRRRGRHLFGAEDS